MGAFGIPTAFVSVINTDQTFRVATGGSRIEGGEKGSLGEHDLLRCQPDHIQAEVKCGTVVVWRGHPARCLWLRFKHASVGADHQRATECVCIIQFILEGKVFR